MQTMHNYPNWDKSYLDITFTIILHYLDSIRTDEVSHHYSEIADYIKEISGSDDGQIYKIYDEYKSKKIIQDEKINIVLTTIHKVKGLEFDVVIVTPSFADLPLSLTSRERNRDYLNGRIFADDKADIDEEKRLLFVAYTRAKKRLFAYKWKREFAIENNTISHAPNNVTLKFVEKDAGLDKYFLSYTAKNGKFNKDEYIRNKVKKDDPVVVAGIPMRNQQGNNYWEFEIRHNSNTIGRLASESNIVKQCILQTSAR